MLQARIQWKPILFYVISISVLATTFEARLRIRISARQTGVDHTATDPSFSKPIPLRLTTIAAKQGNTRSPRC
jgi:hypothetical protein